MRQELRDRVSQLRLGLEDRLDNSIGSLSGGQRQALTLLMASWLQPQLLLLDEHTAALDPKSADHVIRLSEEIVARDRLTTLMVTHSMQQATQSGRPADHDAPRAPCCTTSAAPRSSGCARPTCSRGSRASGAPSCSTSRPPRCCAGCTCRRWPARSTLTLANRADEVPRLVTAVESFGASAGLSDALLFRVMLALDEVVTNIMRHAFDDDDVHEIAISDHGRCRRGHRRRGGRRAGRSIRTPYRPADVHAPLEHRPIGGLGVHLVRSLAQDMAYRRTDGRNVLTLRLTEDVK